MPLEFLHASILDHPRISHAFTTRRGGVSDPPYASLNLSSHRGDEEGAVVANRERVRTGLGLRVLAFSRQVHGSKVLRVDGVRDGIAMLGEGDGLITDRPGVGLVAQTADCVPVLVLDRARPAVAAVHSGWRGTVRNVAGAAVAALTDAFGSDPSELVAAIGPAVSKAHYRVGPEVVDAFHEQFGDMDEDLIGSRDAEGGATLDVGEAVRRQLLQTGIAESSVQRIAVCTFDDDRFYSSRRSGGGAFGAQAGVIGIHPRQ